MGTTKGVDAIAYSAGTGRTLVNKLQAEADGGAWFESQFSDPGMPVRALGTFHTSFEPEDPQLREIFGFAQTRLLELVVEPPRRPQPPPKSILIKAGGTTKSFLSDMSGVFKGPLAEFEILLKGMIGHTSKHPVGALAVSATVPRREAASGTAWQIQFEFRSFGEHAIRCHNPRYHSEEGSGEIAIEIWEQAAAGALGQRVFTLSSRDHELLTGPRRALPSTERYLSLTASEPLRASLEFVFPNIPPGSYILGAIYSSESEKAQRGVVTGTYWADVLPFRVVPP